MTRIQTVLTTTPNPSTYMVIASHGMQKRFYLISKDEARTAYPLLLLHESVCKIARKRFKNEDQLFGGYD